MLSVGIWQRQIWSSLPLISPHPLQCYLHCSTCYVGADRKGTLVEERLYEPLCDPHKLIEVRECISSSAHSKHVLCVSRAVVEGERS